MQISYNQSLLSVPKIFCAFDYVDSRKEKALQPKFPELSLQRNSKEFDKISLSFQKRVRINNYAQTKRCNYTIGGLQPISRDTDNNDVIMYNSPYSL